MVDGLVVGALGLDVLVRLPPGREHLMTVINDLWSWCPARLDGDLDLELEVEQGGGDVPDRLLLEWLTQSVTIEAIEARAGDLLMMHASALAAPDGRVISLIGRSGMGKTTIARTLGRMWAYVTDETVAVDVDGALVPYPKPLSIVEANFGSKRQAAPGDLGLRPLPTSPLSVVASILLDRVSGLDRAEAIEVPRVEALALAAEHTSYLGELDRPLHRLSAALGEQIYRARYSEADQLAPLVAGIMGQPNAETR